MNKFKVFLFVSLFSFGLGTVAAQEEPGLSKDKIRIGMFAPLSGSSMAYGFDPANAARMYYNKINAEGGIHGRKIEVVLEDDRCNANDSVAAVKKLVEQEKVFLLHGGSCSSATIAVKESVERYKIPFVMLNASADAILYPPSPYIYGAFSISQHALGGSMVAFGTDHLKAKTIAYISHDDAFGAANMEAAEFQAKQARANLLIQPIAPSIVDVTSVLLKMKASNPDILLVTTYDRPAALIVKKAFEMGFIKPIVLSINGIADLKQFVDNVGTKDAFKNAYIQYVQSDVPSGPKIKWVYDLYQQSYPELAAKPGYPNAFMINGISSAMTIVKVLQLVGPNLTRQKVLDTLSNLTYDPGVMASPVEFGPNDHAAQESAIYFKFDGTNQTLIPGTFKNLWKYSAK